MVDQQNQLKAEEPIKVPGEDDQPTEQDQLYFESREEMVGAMAGMVGEDGEEEDEQDDFRDQDEEKLLKINQE